MRGLPEKDGNGVVRPRAARAGRARPFQDVMAARFGRRDVLRAAAGAAPILAAPNLLMAGARERDAATDGFYADTLGFTPIAQTTADTVTVPEGYTVDVVARWGDALFSDPPRLGTARMLDGAL